MPQDPETFTSMSVQDRTETALMHESPLVFYMAGLADGVPAWPSVDRDKFLDNIWKEESLLSGAVYSMCAKVGALDFRLKGPRNAVKRNKTMLQGSDLGNGWIRFVMTTTLDMLTQDNGGFIEVLRPPGASPATSAAGIAHLDSQKCTLTGDPEFPVIYIDSHNRQHLLAWYQVISLVDLPSAREEHLGKGFCAISRILRTAQMIRDVALYKRQKLSGKRVPGILFVNGARRNDVKAAITRSMIEESENLDRTLYTGPVIVSGQDSTSNVSAQLVELASLPDGYNEDTLFKWYITSLALAFGTDYSEFAPLPGGGLGSSSQIEGMAARARGKGPGIILQQIEYAMNHYVLPNTVEFQFVSSDPSAETQRIELAHARARERALRVNSEEITPLQALRLAVTEGDAPESFLLEAENQLLPEEETDTEDSIERIIRSAQDLNESYQKIQKVIESKHYVVS